MALLDKLLQNRQIKRIVVWSQDTKVRRGSVSLYDLFGYLLKSNRKFSIDQRASSVAYNLILAAFPGIIFLFTLIPYIPIENLDQQIMEMLRENMPGGIYRDADQTIMDIVSRPRKGVLSFGFIFAMFASTNGMLSLMQAFDMVYEDSETRGFLKVRGIAIMLTLLLIAVLFVSVILLIVGDAVMNLLAGWNIIRDNMLLALLNVTRYTVSFGSLMLTISIIYRFAPSHGRQNKFVNTGSIVASVLILAATYGFSFYLSQFSSYNKLYGSIGTLIALMIWLYLLAFVIILGFEINAGIAELLRARRISKP